MVGQPFTHDQDDPLNASEQCYARNKSICGRNQHFLLDVTDHSCTSSSIHVVGLCSLNRLDAWCCCRRGKIKIRLIVNSIKAAFIRASREFGLYCTGPYLEDIAVGFVISQLLPVMVVEVSSMLVDVLLDYLCIGMGTFSQRAWAFVELG